MPQTFPSAVFQITRRVSPVDNYVYSGCGGKTQAHAASKETPALFYQVKDCLFEPVYVPRAASTAFLLHIHF